MRQASVRGGAIYNLAGSALQDFAPANPVVWTQPQPGGKLLLCFPAAHVHTDFGNDGLHGLDLQARDLRQVDSCNTAQVVLEAETRPLLWCGKHGGIGACSGSDFDFIVFRCRSIR
jgi:hypothetical protein